MTTRLDWILRDYPTRLARFEGVLLTDFVGHVPQLHGSPHEHVMRALDVAVSNHARVGMLGRIRDSRPPEEAHRRELSGRLRELGERLVTVDVAVEGAGFRGVAFRSFVSALRLVGITKVPLHIHADFDAARTAFASTELGTPELLEAVDTFFAGPTDQARRAR